MKLIDETDQKNPSDQALSSDDGKMHQSPAIPIKFTSTRKQRWQPHELMTRNQAAEAIGISLTEFRRREVAGIYTPTVIDTRGWRLYEKEYIAKMPKHEGAPDSVLERASSQTARFAAEIKAKGMAAYEPEIAAVIFEELDKGTETTQIVIKLKIHPDTVKSVYAAWTEHRTLKTGGIMVSAQMLEAISELPLTGTFPVKDEEHLYNIIKDAADQVPICSNCKKNPKQICISCAQPSSPIVMMAPKRRPGRPRKVDVDD